jgi:N-carbamoyl-L-amino-acid hydrolase
MVNGDRLNQRLQALGQVGALAGGGVCRLALTDADKAGRDWLVAEMAALGLAVAIDPVGNIFGTRAGRRDGPHVMIGSHIDTVATGGLYDGALGVLAGLEVVAALNDEGLETDLPVTVAAFTNEEGARFAPDMLGSLVHVGGLPLAEALDIRSIDGSRMGDDLARIGYAGTGTGPRQIAAYFELHIEQGPILADEEVQIGVVEGVQGISWTGITFDGASAHAGTTPLRLRHDAGLAAARVACGVRDLIAQIGPNQLGTVGALTLEPNLVNVVAQTAKMTVDLRNPDNDALVAAEAGLAALIAAAAAEAGVSARTRSLARFDPVAFDPALVAAVEEQAQALGLRHRRMFSGAGHDAQMIARIAPAAMIFVPSRDGISHNIREYTAPEDLARGGKVLHALVRRVSMHN